MRKVMDRKPRCRDCPDSGAVCFVGELYCGRCALERLIRALHAEIADDVVERLGSQAVVLADN